MKKIHLLLLMLVWSPLLWAQAELQTDPYTPAEIEALEGSSTHSYIHDATLVSFSETAGQVDETSLSALSPSSFRLDSIDYVLSLTTNPLANAAETAGKNFEAGIRYKLIHFSSVTGLDSTQWQWLRIDYDALGGTTYRAKDFFLLKDKTYVRLKVDSAYVLDRNAGSVVTDLLPYQNLFQLRQNLTTSRVYRPDPRDAPKIIGTQVTANGGYVQFKWKRVNWARSYDLEWLYVDNYSEDPTDPPLSPLQVGFDFRHNSTRINLTETSYELPLVFDGGYLLFRVRAVGEWGEHPRQRIEGIWSADDQGDVLPTIRGFLELYVFEVIPELIHQDGIINWQHLTDYREEGRREDVMQYLDGTLRPRQSHEVLQTEEQLLITETIFDHQGRPAVHMLPTPYRPGGPAPFPGNPITTKPPLQFVPNFNRNALNQPYNRNDFDLGDPVCLTSADPVAAPVSTNSGAGAYYSNNNPDLAAQQAYVPDAEAYPFTLTEYQPDNTGRIKREGGVGPTHQVGNGHDTRYFYTSPSQDELDRLFGNDAGYAQHYQKHIQLDANGQARVAYKNRNGQVIATALAGEAPDNLVDLANQNTQTITINLIELDNQVDPVSNSLYSNKTIYISGEPGVNIPVTVNYTFAHSTFHPEDCPSLCFSCVYDLQIIIRKDCETDDGGSPIVYRQTTTIGSLGDLTDCDSLTAVINPSPNPLSLEAGRYIITKKLSVNGAAVDQATAAYLSSCPAPDITETPSGTCTTECVLCSPTPLYLGDSTLNYQSGGGAGTFPVIFQAVSDPDCQEICPDDLLNLLESTYQALLGDVSPGGQYGEYYDTTHRVDHPDGIFDPTAFPLSVFNDRTNALPFERANWQYPMGGYRDRDGTESWVPIPLRDDGSLDSLFFRETAEVQLIDGQASVRPQALSRVRDFINNWQLSWAQALVYYHPEYFYYLWSTQYADSFEDDLLIQNTLSFDDAASLGTPTATLSDDDFADDFNGDVFLDGVGGARLEYENRALQFLRKEAGDPDLLRNYTIVEAAIMSTHCGLSTYGPTDIDDCVGTSPLYSGGDPDVLDAEWRTYRSFAVSLKAAVLGDFRQDWIDANGYFSNNDLGRESDRLYGSKDKRFPTKTDSEFFFPDERGNDFTDSWQEFEDYYRQRRQRACQVCDQAMGVESLLNGLMAGGKIRDVIQYPTYPPLAFPEALIDGLGITSAQPVIWNPVINDPTYLQAEIIGDGILQSTVDVYTDGALPLDELVFLTCFKTVSAQEFQAKGYNANFDTTMVFGKVSGLGNFQQCEQSAAPCVQTDLADDLLEFFNYLFQNNLWDNPNYRFYQTFFHPAVSPDMAQVIQDQGFVDGRWQFDSWVSYPNRFLADMTFAAPGISFKYIIQSGDPAFSILDIERFVAILRNYAGSPASDFVLLAETAGGLRFPVAITTKNYFFPPFYCDLPDPELENAAFCCINPIKAPPGPSCASILQDIADGNARLRESNREAQRRAAFRTAYIEHCLSAAESLIVQYAEKLYQHTLYYYDQAGNLIKTVPPKDVDLLTDTEVSQVQTARAAGSGAVYPTHRMASTYNYNSLNEPTKRFLPDNGTTYYCYDELGRAIMSMDAAQQALGQLTYRLYDALSRVVESGVVTTSASFLPAEVTYADFLSTWLSGTKSEVYYNHYDEDLPGTAAYFDPEDRHLRNRLASITYRDSLGAHYDHATHYAYDIQGNKRMVVQDFARLGREFPTGSSCVPGDLNFSDETVGSGVYQTFSNITTSGTVDIPSGNTVVFRANGTIRLGPGFHAAGNFTAQIGPCELTDGPATNDQHLKTIQYDYQLLSGKVRRVLYQGGREDQFVHWYTYDADNRLESVTTSTFPEEPEDLRDRDAHYTYYTHGPLARLELGQELVQGLDFAYTLQGWLKGMNPTTLFPERDPGEDGLPIGGLGHELFARDAFGFALHYFENDYVPIGGIPAVDRFHTDLSGSILPTADYPALYNGSVWAATYGNQAFDSNPVQLHAYRYDQLNRLKGSQLLRNPDLTNNGWLDTSFGNAFAGTYTYDPNGNITALTRRDGSGSLLDNLTYRYYQADRKNQLRRVDDSAATPYAQDLEDQAGNNYVYDPKGRLISDLSEAMSTLEWFNNDKLKTIRQNGEDIQLSYSAKGHRVLKQDPEKTTYYVRDDQGLLLATYEIEDGETRWKSAGLFGQNRLGTFRPDLLLDGEPDNTITQIRGQRQYEISNQVGNVQSLLSDRKIPSTVGGTYFLADVLNATDYYPFGMPMPERQWQNRSHAYGFQGMEVDQEWKGAGNSYSTEYRQYDPRIGRWLSVDEVVKPYDNPYMGLANNPVFFRDPLGLDDHGYVLRPNREAITEALLASLEDDSVDPLFGVTGDIYNDPLYGLDGEIEMGDDPIAGLDWWDLEEVPVAPPRPRSRTRAGTPAPAPVTETPEMIDMEDAQVVVDRGEGPTLPAADPEDPAPDIIGGVGNTLGVISTVDRVLDVRDAVRAAEEGSRLAQGARAALPLAEDALSASRIGGRLTPGVGAALSTAGMLSNIYDNAEAYSNGDISGGEYARRATINVAAGVVGVAVPFGDTFINWALDANPDED